MEFAKCREGWKRGQDTYFFADFMQILSLYGLENLSSTTPAATIFLQQVKHIALTSFDIE